MPTYRWSRPSCMPTSCCSASRNPALAACLDASTGQALWTQRLGGSYRVSPVVAENRRYCLADDGSTVVLAADREFKLVGPHPLEGPCKASPAISNGRIFIRSQSSLFCIRRSGREKPRHTSPSAPQGTRPPRGSPELHSRIPRLHDLNRRTQDEEPAGLERPSRCSARVRACSGTPSGPPSEPAWQTKTPVFGSSSRHLSQAGHWARQERMPRPGSWQLTEGSTCGLPTAHAACRGTPES